jgi:hypothetical protein
MGNLLFCLLQRQGLGVLLVSVVKEIKPNLSEIADTKIWRCKLPIKQEKLVKKIMG